MLTSSPPAGSKPEAVTAAFSEVVTSSLLPPQAVNPSALTNAIRSIEGPGFEPECWLFFGLDDTPDGGIKSE
jgi:hypothetical protein